MTEKYSLVKKVFQVGIVKFGSQGVTLILSLLLANALSLDEFGQVSYILSVLAIVSGFIVSGVPTLVVREVGILKAGNNGDELKGFAIFSVLFVGSVYAVIYLATRIFTNSSAFSDLFDEYGLWGLLLSMSLLLTASAWLNGYGYSVISQVMNRFLVYSVTVLIISLYILNQAITVELVFDVMAIAYTGVSVVAIGLVINQLLFAGGDWKKGIRFRIKKWIRPMPSMSGVAYITLLNTEITIILITLLDNEQGTGLLKIAVQISAFLGAVMQIVAVVLNPKIAILSAEGKVDELQKIVTMSALLLSSWSVTTLILLLLFGDEFLVYVLGEDYAIAYIPMMILALAQVVSSYSGIAPGLMNMTGQHNKVLIAKTAALIVLVILSYILIPLYGVNGAALSVLISVSISNVYLAYAAYRSLNIRTWLIPADIYKFRMRNESV